MLKKQSRRHLKKLNNSGSTMLIVLVAIALISVLASVLMSMSYLNYSMKVTELNSKKNFYTAEMVLDQINVGLQTEISESVEDAYLQSMQRYTLDNDTVRNTTFANYYVSELRGRLRTIDEDSKYQIAGLDTDSDGVFDRGLVQYLDSNLQAAYASGSLKITSTDSKMESVAIAKTDEAGNTVYEAQGLVLYNLKIEYTDAAEYTSIIETDIRLKTPSLTLVTKTAMPNVFDYSLVADGGILGGAAGSTTTFVGNVYAGNDYVDGGGISATQGCDWKFTDKARVVSGGPVSVAANASIEAGDETDCWFQGIKLSKVYGISSGTLKLLGTTCVEDDLTIEGNSAGVTLAGKYIGFGNVAEAEGSSAIILNGTDSILDMTGLDDLMLGGNSYIQTSEVTYSPTAYFAEGHNTDILMGSSLAVKSDQIAYMVPAECIGVYNGVTEIGRNPMTEADYITWQTFLNNQLSGVAGYEAVSLTKEMSAVGKSIAEYDYNGTGYKTIFRQVNGESLCYLYLDLNADGAANYYQDYYNGAEAKMKRYIATYNNRVLIDPTVVDYETKGTMLSYALGDDGAISIIDNTMNETRTTAELDAIVNEQNTYAERFARLQAKLTLEAGDVSADELTKTVYHNLINDTVLSGVSGSKTYEYDISATEKLKAVFVNNRGGANYIYNDSEVCVIVATGNVELNRDFSGLLICDGKVILNSGVMTVEPDKEKVLKMLRTKESADADAKSLIAAYFINGDKYSMDTSLTGQVTNTWAGQQMSEMIVYENWTKQ